MKDKRKYTLLVILLAFGGAGIAFSIIPLIQYFGFVNTWIEELGKVITILILIFSALPLIIAGAPDYIKDRYKSETQTKEDF